MSSAEKPKPPSPHLPEIDGHQGLTHLAPSTPSYAHEFQPQHPSTHSEPTVVKTPASQSETTSENDSPKQPNSENVVVPRYPNPHPPRSRSRNSEFRGSKSSLSLAPGDSDGSDFLMSDFMFTQSDNIEKQREDLKTILKYLTDNLPELIGTPDKFDSSFQ